MARFTERQFDDAKNTDLAAFLRSRGEKLVRSGSEYRLVSGRPAKAPLSYPTASIRPSPAINTATMSVSSTSETRRAVTALT